MHRDQIKEMLEETGINVGEYDIVLADFAMRVQRCNCLDELMHYAEISEDERIKAIISNLALLLATKWGIFRGRIN